MATIRPSSLSSFVTLTTSSTNGSGRVAETGAISGFVIKSTESPRHPAACRGLRPGGGDMARSLSRVVLYWAMIFLLNTPSYLRRAAGGTGGVRVSWGSCAALTAVFGGYP
jgi:hypothetical protein